MSSADVDPSEPSAPAHGVAPRRFKLIGAGALVVVIAVAAFVVVSRRDDGADEAALEKASTSSQILHYRLTQDQTNFDDSPLGKHVHDTVDQWIDLASGATHVVIDTPGLSKNTRIDPEPDRLESWSDGKRTQWTVGNPSESADPSRTTIDKITSPSPPKQRAANNPILLMRRALAAAAAGKATSSDGGTWHGIPVTKVVVREPRTTPTSPQVTTTQWIVEAGGPRLLRGVVDIRKADGTRQSTTASVTTAWQYYRGSDPAARRHVDVPRFDPANYRVVNPLLTTQPGG